MTCTRENIFDILNKGFEFDKHMELIHRLFDLQYGSLQLHRLFDKVHFCLHLFAVEDCLLSDFLTGQIMHR